MMPVRTQAVHPQLERPAPFIFLLLAINCLPSKRLAHSSGSLMGTDFIRLVRLQLSQGMEPSMLTPIWGNFRRLERMVPSSGCIGAKVLSLMCLPRQRLALMGRSILAAAENMPGGAAISMR